MHASTVWRILDHAAIKPHRIRYWLHSKDPNFAAKAREIIDLYTNPPPGAVVLSCDEKPGIQAREPFQEWAPDAERRRQARREFHYRRHGTVNLIAALNVRTGEVFGMCADRNRHQEFVAFLEEIVRRHPTGEVHLILDNLATHKHAKVKELIAAQGGRIRLHFTPTHSSWMNQIEIWFSTLSRRLLRRGSFSSRDDLKAQLAAFIAEYNEQSAKPYKWTYTGKTLAA